MQTSITAVVVMLLALGAAYVITRPIGDRRRHIAATMLAGAVGIISGFITNEMTFYVSAALVSAAAGMILAWRARNPAIPPKVQTKPRRSSSRKPHYRGLTRA